MKIVEVKKIIVEPGLDSGRGCIDNPTIWLVTLDIGRPLLVFTSKYTDDRYHEYNYSVDNIYQLVVEAKSFPTWGLEEVTAIEIEVEEDTGKPIIIKKR